MENSIKCRLPRTSLWIKLNILINDPARAWYRQVHRPAADLKCSGREKLKEMNWGSSQRAEGRQNRWRSSLARWKSFKLLLRDQLQARSEDRQWLSTMSKNEVALTALCSPQAQETLNIITKGSGTKGNTVPPYSQSRVIHIWMAVHRSGHYAPPKRHESQKRAKETQNDDAEGLLHERETLRATLLI